MAKIVVPFIVVIAIVLSLLFFKFSLDFQLVALIAFSMLILLGVVVWVFNNYIYSGIDQITQITNSIQSGNEISKSLLEREDEFGQIIKRLVDTQNSIHTASQESLEVIKAISIGDLDREINEISCGNFEEMQSGITDSFQTVKAIITVFEEMMLQIKTADYSDHKINSNLSGAWLTVYQAIIDAKESTKVIVDSIGSVMDHMAEGDLSYYVDAEASGEMENLKHRINASFDDLSVSFTSIRENILQVSNATSEASTAISQIADGAMTQNDAIGQLSNAVDESNTAIGDVRQNTDFANQSIQEMAVSVSLGQDKMQNMMDIVHKISESSRKIDKITDMIGEIANKTNMLSLNASIEAARAGEAGKGFAVVATEVGNLAESASKSVAEINQLVAESVDFTDIAVESAKEVSEEMEEINELTGQNKQVIQQIAVAMEEQSATMDNINNNVANLREIAENNAAASEEITATMMDLSGTASNVMDDLNKFKLRQTGGEFGVMRQAHLDWRKVVNDVVSGRKDANEVKVVSHRDCKLGKWLYSEGMSSYGHLAEMQDLEKHHETMHHCVKDVMSHKKNNNQIAAEESQQCVSEMSGKVVDLLYKVEGKVS
jgi:methyl-accepting chemotaxis protein